MEDGEVRVTGEYLVGADGARSSVRRLIGCTFDGFTYDKMVVATNVFYPFRENGFTNSQFIIHPEHFAMVWPSMPQANPRLEKYLQMECIVYLMVRTHRYRTRKHERIWINKFNTIFPGPKPVKYDLRMFSPYKLHQRRSNKFRVGKVLLAGDAAHACNPFGGMGLTGGICDAGGLIDCLIGVLRKGCDDNLLDKYASIRQTDFQ